MSVQLCPKCAYSIPPERQGTGECPHCGVIFAKFDSEEPAMRPLTRVGEKKGGRPSGAIFLLWVFVVLVGIFVLSPGGSDDDSEVPGDAASGTTEEADGPVTVDDDDSGPSLGMTAADLRSNPDLEQYGDPDPNRAPIALTESQLEDARAALAAEETGLKVEFSPFDEDEDEEPEPGESALRTERSQTTRTRVQPGGADAEVDTALAFVGWYEGAAGYQRASRQATRMGRPMVVYFHTDWCGYCKRFDADFLPDPLMRRFLSNVIRVHINPEDGDDEMALAHRYGVGGYPSFYVQAGASDPTTARRVHPFRDGGTIPIQQFVAECEAASGG